MPKVDGLFQVFQLGVHRWLCKCQGYTVAMDKPERGFRFIEEALELVQANGTSKEDVLKVVEYVYNRPEGSLSQEVGGTLVTLAALCEACQLDMDKCGWTELDRCWEKIELIRAKQKDKVRNPNLPQSPMHRKD